jgi:hypothetical protein
MSGHYRIFVWMIALAGAALPFGTLWFFIPEESLASIARMSTLVDIPDKLVPEFAFIGVAIFISCLPDWLSDEHFRTFKQARQKWLIGFRSICSACAVISFLYYIRIVLNINGIVDKKFTFDLATNKFALFAWVVAVCVTSLAAVLFHLGPPREA